MYRIIISLAIVAIVISFTSCGNQASESNSTAENNAMIEDSASNSRVTHVRTYEEQKNMSPDTVIQYLKDGNTRFVNDNLTSRDHSVQIRKSAEGQFPKAIILSCVDSRVPVEDVFDVGIGDVFVARVAGNFVNEDILGSMEFACNNSGAKVILVLGHERCGAVGASIGDHEASNLSAMLLKIRPAVDSVVGFDKKDRVASNPKFVSAVCESNIRNNMINIRARSPILKVMEDSLRLKIVGGVYDMITGEVKFLQE